MLQWICWWCIPSRLIVVSLILLLPLPSDRCIVWLLLLFLSSPSILGACCPSSPCMRGACLFMFWMFDTLLWMLVAAFSIDVSWCFVKMSHLAAHLLVMLALCLAWLLLPLSESVLVLLCCRLCDCSLYLLWAHLGRCSEIAAQLPLKIQMLNCIVRLWSSLYTFLTGQLSLSL